MKHRRAALVIAAILISCFVSGCELASMDEAEFSAMLIKGVTDKGKAFIEFADVG